MEGAILDAAPPPQVHYVGRPPVSETKVLVPAGMLGAGFTAAALERGIALGAHAIAIDGGSTDSGPYYLGAAAPKMPEEAIAADIRLMLVHGAAAGIPVLFGSAG